ncbi:hypothetical protein HY572_00585 [Candidatus Micrarchaeota archaeon]|nr:hypothetical protein [Candidatus Micrarchaeota archaeon]
MAKFNLRKLFGNFRPPERVQARQKIRGLVAQRDASRLRHVFRVSDLSPRARKALVAALVGTALLGASAAGLSLLSSHLNRVNRQLDVEMQRQQVQSRQQEFRSYQNEQAARRRRGMPVQTLDEYHRSTYQVAPEAPDWVPKPEQTPAFKAPKWVPSEEEASPRPSPSTQRPADLRKLAGRTRPRRMARR